MKKLITVLVAIGSVLTTSSSVISCNADYKNYFNSLVNKISGENNLVIRAENISSDIKNGQTIFAIKNALNINLHDMNYVSITSNGANQLRLQSGVSLNVTVKVLSKKESFTKTFIWEKNALGDINNTYVNALYKDKTNNLYGLTSDGIFYEDSENNTFYKITTNYFNDDDIYTMFQTGFGTIFVGTNKGLFYSNNGIEYEQITSITSPVYEVIQAANGYIYLNLKSNGLYYSNDFGKSFHKISSTIIPNKIITYGNDIYLCANDGVYDLDLNNLSKDSRFSSLSNINDIYFINNNFAYIISNNNLYYFHKILGLSILNEIQNTNDGNSLGKIYSISSVISLNKYLYFTSSNGTFYCPNESIPKLYTLNQFSEMKYSIISSYFPYTIYLYQPSSVANIKGINFYEINIKTFINVGE